MTDWFEDFLQTGTVNRETVDVHMNMAAVAKAQKLIARHEKLSQESGERAVGEASPLAEIERQLEELEPEIERGKMTVTVVPVDEPTRQRIIASLPNPPAPRSPGTSAPKEKLDAFGAAVVAYQEACKAVGVERDIAYAAAAIESVEHGRQQRPPLTVDQVRDLRNRPHGKAQFEAILEAALEVSNTSNEVSRPKSRTSSESETI